MYPYGRSATVHAWVSSDNGQLGNACLREAVTTARFFKREEEKKELNEPPSTFTSPQNSDSLHNYRP